MDTLCCRQCQAPLRMPHAETCPEWHHTDWVIERQCDPKPAHPAEAATRENVKNVIRKALVDTVRNYELATTTHPDILKAGCKAIGYLDPEDAAEKTAYIVADAILALSTHQQQGAEITRLISSFRARAERTRDTIRTLSHDSHSRVVLGEIAKEYDEAADALSRAPQPDTVRDAARRICIAMGYDPDAVWSINDGPSWPNDSGESRLDVAMRAYEQQRFITIATAALSARGK